MKLLVVNYGRQRGHDDAEQAREFSAAAQKIAGVPGLVWKLWSYDDDAQTAASIYLFDSEESARAWGDGPMKPALSGHDGIGDIEVSYFDVDEDLSAITRAPLTAHQSA
jgi:heme-degrading monooxygenase HmoA